MYTVRLQKENHINRLHNVRKLLFFAAFICAFSLPGEVHATHLIGGDLRYKCLGNNRYELTLTYRRDCYLGAPGTEFEPFAHIGVYDLTTNSLITGLGPGGSNVFRIPHDPIDTANQVLINDCTLAGDDLCVEQTIYRGIVILPFRATGYRLIYQRCCRNMSLNNVDDPLNTGMTLSALLSSHAQTECNNSPILGDFPPIFICLDEPLDYQFEATDPDGDSLVFELFTPRLGASDDQALPTLPVWPVDTIEWLSPPYSLENLMNPVGGGVPLSIDRFSGVMTATPNTIGQFLVGVRILSYRNGVLIERTTREWQFNVRPCQDPPTAIIDSTTLLSCDGLIINFGENSISADQYFWIFDYGNPDSETSTEQNPSYDYPTNGNYTVALIVNDADSLCFDTTFATAGVFNSTLLADFELGIPSCDMPIIIQATDQSDDPDPNYDVTDWQYILSYPGGADTLNLQFPLFSLDTSTQGVNLSLTVTSSNGCTAVFDTTFDANVIGLPFKGDTIGLCSGDSIALFDTPGGDFEYTWSPTETLILTDPANPIAFPSVPTTYYVTVTDGLCVVEDSVSVGIIPLPVLAFSTFTDCRSLVLELMNTSAGASEYIWDFGDGNMSGEEEPVHTYDSAGVYTVTLHADGCAVSISQEVTVSMIADSVDNESISCFAMPVELNPDGSSEYLYMWSPSEGLDEDDIPNPTANPSTTTTYYVTITDADLPGCSVLDSVQVIVGEDFSLQATGDSAYCEALPIMLTAGNNDLMYEWYDLGDSLLGVGPELLVVPTEETSYILVGTDDLGCDKRDTITLSPKIFELETSTESAIICFGDSTELSVTDNGTSDSLTYTWTPTEYIVGANNGPTILAKPGFRDQMYYVTVENEIGCTTTDSVLVQVSTFDIEFAPSVLICRGDEIQLQVGNFDTTNLQFTWTPTETIVSGANTASPTVNPTETTTYTAHIVNLDHGCETFIEVTVNVSWFTPDFLEIFVNNDTVILNDSFFILSTNQDPNLTFLWEGLDIDGDPTSPEITITPTMEGENPVMVTVTNMDGCMLIGQILLTVLDPLCNEETVFIPDAFSPNGDGQNDELQVYGNYIEQLELRIFNRWGEQVFEAHSQGEHWDGTFNGKDLPPDVFGYYMRVVCTPNKPFFKKGNITLFR